MTGHEFKNFRIGLRVTLQSMSDILGFNNRQSVNYYETMEEVPVIMEIFFNYTQRFGYEQAKSEFSQRFRSE